MELRALPWTSGDAIRRKRRHGLRKGWAAEWGTIAVADRGNRVAKALVGENAIVLELEVVF